MRSQGWWRALALVAILATGIRAADVATGTPFDTALREAEEALAAGNAPQARHNVDRALERDPKSAAAWRLRARWAAAAAETDEQVYALHRHLALRVAQGAKKSEVRELRAELDSVDPVAADLLALRTKYSARLQAMAEDYDKSGRPHSAIRAYQQVLALDPERVDIEDAIQRISSRPDPSLAETAREKDLLADVSESWMREHDAKHATWDDRAKLERDNYVTHTDAGYAVAIRTAEAMEQMNAFYRIFFEHGTEEDGGSVPRIEVRIFKNRDEYLELGSGPPVAWSGGQFTGGAVETYIGEGGFESMTGTLFHEAAHQFVSLATNAVGWLNEGLASFFEGTRMLPNGTVLMNLPATGRLFPLATRMSNGWMESAADGIDPADASASNPTKAPTFRIVLENEYDWGPPWYAPTWGVVYFLYNFQDPADGRFVYRSAFHEYIDASGGKTGKSAISTFEEVVLKHPSNETKGLDRGDAPPLVLPQKVDDVDALWRDWILRLRDEQQGTLEVERPYLAWAQHAITRKEYRVATEHFEKGLVRAPFDVDLLAAFADHLAEREKNTDRATKLIEQATRVLEARADTADEKRLDALEARLIKWDPQRRSLKRVLDEIRTSATSIVERYRDAGQHLMTMFVSWRLGSALRIPGMLGYFEEAVRASGKSLTLWQLAYNERDLRGWSPAESRVFQAYGTMLRSSFGAYEKERWDYAFLTLDQPTSGDYSFETEVSADDGDNAFCGLVFGKKSDTTFHSVVFFPKGTVDLVSFYGGGEFRTWRSGGVKTAGRLWHTIRLDVSGKTVDVWANGELVVTQEFASEDVLSGSFGLITGRGKAQFRNVRFLARERGDPGAGVERKLRFERLTDAGGAVAGSYQGLVPPFPVAKEWLKGGRTSWTERGPVPMLLVLWSERQNDVIPLHEWLTHIAAAQKEIGLEIIAVCQKGEEGAARKYLATHGFPAHVMVDDLDTKVGGYGTTFDAYFIGARFNLPRAIVLDIDHTVFWEGNPGFTAEKPWKEGTSCAAEDAIADLAGRRNLVALRPWLAAWTADGGAALRAGRVADAAEALLASRHLPAEQVPDVALAHGALVAIEGALSNVETTANTLAATGHEPALAALLAWGDALGADVPPKVRRSLARVLNSENARAWKSALSAVHAKSRELKKKPFDAATVDGLATAFEALAGDLPARAAAAIRTALAADDLAAARAVVDDIESMPERWLAAEHFRF